MSPPTVSRQTAFPALVWSCTLRPGEPRRAPAVAEGLHHNDSVICFIRLYLAAGCSLILVAAAPAHAQVDYRNIDTGRPTRIGDATPTERKALELSMTSARLERLTLGRYRLQLEPRLAYGILPNTEMSLRMPVYFYERSLSPRAGIGGVGVGGEHQLLMEGLRVPALAIAAEMFVPTGPNAIKTSYSGKALLTRTLSRYRAHINGGAGSFSFRVPAGAVTIIPPLHGPCMLDPGGEIAIRGMCAAPMPAEVLTAATAMSMHEVRTHAYWTAGLAIDRTFPLQSLVVIADVFTQKYNGIGRDPDWTAELGARKQVTRALVVDGAVGRLFTGESRAWFVTFGTTFTRAGRI